MRPYLGSTARLWHSKSDGFLGASIQPIFAKHLSMCQALFSSAEDANGDKPVKDICPYRASILVEKLDNK